MNTFEQVNEYYNKRNYAQLANFIKYLGSRDMRDHWMRYQRDYAQGAFDVMRGGVWGPRSVVEVKPERTPAAVFGEYDARIFALSTMVEGERYRFEPISPDPAPTITIRNTKTRSAERTIEAVYVGVREGRAMFEDVTVYSAFIEVTTNTEFEDVEFLYSTEIPLEELRANYRIVSDALVSEHQLALV